MELIYREDPKILWIFRQETKLFWKTTITPLAHTQEDSFDIDEMEIVDNTIKISMTSVLTGDEEDVRIPFFAYDECQKYREVNRILFYDGLNPDYTDKLNSKQLELEKQKLINICQAHFNDCDFCDYLRE